MRAGLRFTTILLAFGIGIPASAARAQNTTEPASTSTPATDSVGPRELQNFSLPGTRTRPADPPATIPVVNPPPPRTDSTPAETREPATRATSPRQVASRPTVTPTRSAPVAAAPLTTPDLPLTQPTPAPFASRTLPATPAPQPVAPVDPATSPGFSIWPWLAAALALGAGAAFLLWRRRPREEFADGPHFDMFVAPEAAPPPRREPQLPPIPRAPPAAAPKLQPAAPKPEAPVASGLVSSRLRPSIEIGVQPLRCLVEDNQVTIEFELELFNSGSAPARAVLAEASMFNAGVTQDEQLARFFANPVAAGSGIDAIPPLKRINLTSKVVAPRDAIQEYELGGRRAFVPVIAFNALYDWSGGKAQTSSAYLVGRETRGDKLGPLHLDDEAKRDVRGLGARELPSQLRT